MGEAARSKHCQVVVRGQGLDAIESITSIVEEMVCEGWQLEFVDADEERRWIIFSKVK